MSEKEKKDSKKHIDTLRDSPDLLFESVKARITSETKPVEPQPSKKKDEK